MTTKEQTSQESEIKFYIVKVINNINKTNVTYSELGDELNSFNNNNIQSKLQRLKEDDVVRTAVYQDRDRTKNKRREYAGHGRVSKKPRFLSG